MPTRPAPSLRSPCPQPSLELGITYLPSTVKGQFWRLYMIVDIYSRAIVGWEVHAEELASHAAAAGRHALVQSAFGE